PFAADVLRLERPALQFLEGGVEALDVADLQHGPVPAAQRGQLLCLGKVEGERLLGQDGDAAAEEVAGDGVVVGGGDDDHGGIDERQKLAVVGEGAGAAAAGDGLGL